MIVWDLVYSMSEPDFWTSFSVSHHVTSNFVECQCYRTFKGPYFFIAWHYSHMVGFAGSHIRIVHADMTLTRYKVKVTWRWPSHPSGAFIMGWMCFLSPMRQCQSSERNSETHTNIRLSNSYHISPLGVSNFVLHLYADLCSVSTTSMLSLVCH